MSGHWSDSNGVYVLDRIPGEYWDFKEPHLERAKAGLLTRMLAAQERLDDYIGAEVGAGRFPDNPVFMARVLESEAARLRAIKGKLAIGNDLRVQVFERDAWECVECGNERGLSADHIYPESKGGPTELWNLQTLCRSCNSRKGVSVPQCRTAS